MSRLFIAPFITGFLMVNSKIPALIVSNLSHGKSTMTTAIAINVKNVASNLSFIASK
jgi:hypothetical protein